MNLKSDRRWKWLLIPIFMMFLVVAGAVYLNYYWKPILSSRIKEAIHNSTNGLYRIQFDNIRVNFITGQLKVTNISFEPDSIIYQKMMSDSIAPQHLYTIRVSELTLKRINPIKIYFDKVLEMRSIEIERPKLEIMFNDLKYARDSLKEDSRTAWQRLSPYLNRVRIGEIVFRDADFSYEDYGADKNKITELKGLHLKISDLLVDSASQYDPSRLYHTKDIYAELNNYKVTSLDSNYDVNIDQVQASTSGRYARIRGFKLIPRYGELDFSKRFEYRKERYSVRLDELLLNRIDFKLLNRERRLSAQSLDFNNLRLSIFVNRAMPDSLRDKGQNFPAIALQRFRLNTSIDSINLKEATINYSEYNPDSQRKGTVTFSKIDGHILNVSNDSARLSKDKFSHAKLTALIMDRGRFNVAMKFDLKSPQAAFEFKGDVGLMDANEFNTAIRPLSLILIRSGELKKLEFQAKGTNKGVKGDLALFYNDLKISLLERSESTTWLKRKSIASIFANVLIIKNHNPMPGQKVRKADFSYNRPAHSSFFNMIWKGMASALLESIGFDAATQREIQSRLRRMETEQNAREGRKDDRLRKRDVRRSNRE